MDRQSGSAPRRLGLVGQIIVGLVLAVAVGTLTRGTAAAVYVAPIGEILGDLFVGALKAVAPVLVFLLVISAMSQPKGPGIKTNIRPILLMYLAGTFAGALVAVSASFLFPSTLQLSGIEAIKDPAPANIGEVLRGVLVNLVANPVSAIANGNYISILMWAVLLGTAFRQAGEQTRELIHDAANAVVRIISWVIRMAPAGIFGLLLTTIMSEQGFDGMLQYVHLLTVLLGAMVVMALVVNPLLVFLVMKKNPYPLVFTCLRESGVTAFFTRSSAANIPVNMALARRLGLRESTYTVSIPLGATINMSGAAITITVLTLAAVNTLGISVDFPTAVLLSVVAALGACGTSGVAGGSLLLVPMACSLFNIDQNIAMQVVGVGFVLSVLQDSAETALNSSTDVLFTAAVDLSEQQRH
ncbi:MAG: serine/threonine transporter SstT [Lautropia sp.]|nr:serine/threonine transporter SstT [Lautropia sp.]